MTKPQRRGHSGRAHDNNQRYRNAIKRQAEAGDPLPALTVLHMDIAEAYRGAGHTQEQLPEHMDCQCPWRRAFDASAH